LAQFSEQPRLLHCNGRLRRKILEQRNFLFGERPDLASSYRNCAEQRIILAQGRHQQSVDARRDVRSRDGGVELTQIGDVNVWSAIDQRLEERVIGAAGRPPLPQSARQRFSISTLYDSAPRLALKDPQGAESSAAKPMRLFEDRLEHWC